MRQTCKQHVANHGDKRSVKHWSIIKNLPLTYSILGCLLCWISPYHQDLSLCILFLCFLPRFFSQLSTSLTIERQRNNKLWLCFDRPHVVYASRVIDICLVLTFDRWLPIWQQEHLPIFVLGFPCRLQSRLKNLHDIFSRCNTIGDMSFWWNCHLYFNRMVRTNFFRLTDSFLAIDRLTNGKTDYFLRRSLFSRIS